MRCPSNLHR
uniref:Uncharacterized protein n=1 Tax=Anguilla anguilla TaxID=7936 RepID=A0A0E9S5K5_ANGAN